ncbi:Homeobox-leucine zipper protein HAT22 [Striga hermonthica]|uniref:Homeobox-leucine zipper protein HAT22 n=1 Tax=Striga hermonthica TaxID=68872 RepID=A0A9N7R8Z9_STRHE|nr:Homeobox-leucine zipper protein HAT22 [Striga hermonthica]
MGFDDLCNTGLALRLGFSPSSSAGEHNSEKPAAHPPAQLKLGFLCKIEPSLTLSLSGETFELDPPKKSADFDQNRGKIADRRRDQSGDDDLYRQDSAASSFSNVSSVKREREPGSEEVERERAISSRVSDEDDDGSNGRKKLRLSKAQSALLEESFKHHSTLNPKQKQDLARELKLRPRQVEVWFQNRRARTKLKQTEVDCEFLKKCCETLTDENHRLQKELQELKALKSAQPLYMQLPAATLTMCPSCERIGGGNGGSENAAKKPGFVMAPKPHFYNPFTNSSAAC